MESFVGGTQIHEDMSLEPPVRQPLIFDDTPAGLAGSMLDSLRRPDEMFGGRVTVESPPFVQDSLSIPRAPLAPSMDFEADSPAIKPLSLSAACLVKLARRKSQARKRPSVAEASRTTRSRASQTSHGATVIIDCACRTPQEESNMV